MKIPPRFQVFATVVVLSDKDALRLQPALAGWPTLNRVVLQEETPRTDLERLIIMELLGKRRLVLVNRLVMRLGKLHRREIRERIEKALQ